MRCCAEGGMRVRRMRGIREVREKGEKRVVRVRRWAVFISAEVCCRIWDGDR